MSEEIVFQTRWGSATWRDEQVIDGALIAAYGITPEQVVAHFRQHPNPLERLFIPRPQHRILYRLCDEQEYGRWSLTE